ncbi:hypothetical protein CERZMDRAFT_84530 [Cercospora zeae-maydis SCOH1-5]|uniref:Carboxymuconolactone decarboxylase-like domain-containing protein n=1 Tax=Cercospora zeae-maydis SCOH1-5 TaxID=717836 RepID=A0A6A6FHS5_9PEZI|nr:hypothetical protein CERZMDRAFT_84530 [Cercospora zeae-maydis SCOH1-5]
MRIPYAPSEPPADAIEETKAIYHRIAERRKPRPLIPLDLALLHNPAIADGYNSLLGAIRTKSSFPLELAELAICYIAVLNTATYEWTAHAPIYLKAGGTREKLEVVLQGDVRNESVLSEEERDVLAFTEQSTRNIKVEDGLFAKIKERYTEQQVMELTITIGGYNMVSRFLVGLDVTESNGKEMVLPPA